MGHPAMKKRGTNFVPGTNSVPEIDEDDDFSAKFKAVIMPFPRKHVAKIAKCSTETVKAWCKDPPRQKPQWEHMYRLALGLKGVRNLIRREIDPTFASPRAMHEVINSLQDLADQPGPEGDTARAILRNAMGAMS